MGLLSSFKRKAADSQTATADEPVGDAVQLARTRARRRLIGAVVLLLIGIIGFPIVFETQPRPIPLDIPIEIPRKDTAPPLVMPAAAPRHDESLGTQPGAPAHAAGDGIITEGREVATQKPLAEAAQKSAATATTATKKPTVAQDIPKPTTMAEAQPATTAADASKRPVSEVVKKAAEVAKTGTQTATAAPADAVRARSLLDGNGGTATDSGRFVVQVGAFADAGAAREVRHRVEKLGLKTYTQVAQTASGSRIRVRVGPFATRGEADRALAKARSAGLSAVVLTL